MNKKLIFSLLFGAALALTANVVQAQNSESYESLMKKGNDKFSTKDYISAKTYYEMALKQKANDPTARKKLDETLKKIQEDGARQEVFYAHLDAGDQLCAQQKYEQALAEYEQALKVFPDDKYVGGQAETVRTILKERQDKQDAYDTAMSQGEALLAEENFDAAIFQFETANQIFPDDKLPKEKLAEARQKKQLYTEKVTLFDKTMEEARQLGLRKNYEAAIDKLDQALELFPNDLQANTMKSEYAAAKDQTDRYNGIIAEADRLYENKAYKEARSHYQSALAVVAGDAYATDMIARLDPLIAQQDAEEAARIAAEQEAARLAAEAEAARIAAEQEAARLAAEEAARIAAEQEAARLAAEAEAARIAAEEEAARQAALAAAEAERQATIKTMLDAANALFDQQDYANAKVKYQEVVAFDEGNATATGKIAEIDGILAQMAAEIEERYSNAMNAGNQAMSAEKFADAVTHYQSALVYKPEDPTATAQLVVAEKAENDRLAALRSQYNAFIKEGDANFKSNTFDKAIEAYTKAEELHLETYPSEMIARISEIIEQNKLYELNTDYISLAAGEARRFEFNKIEVAVRRSNYIIIKVRNPQPDKTFPMIVSFGGQGGKNGGFVLPIAATDEEKTFVFRIGAQYKWFSEDNTWIEIISENHPVEIGKLEVSRSN
jgi:tetratricopeptide (TPR) repeat protein